MIKRLCVISMAILMMASVADAKEVAGVNLPDTLKAGKQNLILNGAGLRSRMWIKVYVIGLYLVKKSKDANMVINSDEPMAVRMHFIYKKVEAKQLAEGMVDGIKKGTGGNIAPVQKELDQFISFYKGDVNTNDIHDLIYIPGKGLNVYMKGKLMGTIKGLAFKKALFSMWFGKDPVDSDLKEGMLDD